MERIVLVTGGFDPLHSGHIAYFKEAKKLGTKLIVGVNSDDWLTRKKGRPFMSWDERVAIIQELSIVDEVIGFDDTDNSANKAIYKCLTKYKDTKICFANGGDRTDFTTPEYKIYGKTPWVDFEFGVGGEDKKNSSSWILEEWKNPKTIREWGWYRILDDQPEKGYKVKELVILPGKSLSDQRHKHRSEMWYVTQGQVTMSIQIEGDPLTGFELPALVNGYNIGSNIWHKAMNNQDVPAHVIEVQFGEKCVEEDIERRD
jgi:cytidyltransferase-like protein